MPLAVCLALLALPLLGRWVPAEFPTPVDDSLEGQTNTATFLIERPHLSRRVYETLIIFPEYRTLPDW